MIYLLTRIGDVNYEENAGFVIRAESESEARSIANDGTISGEGQIWTDPTKVKCEEVDPLGTSQIILIDFYAG